jgi:hypothetical protein
MLDDRCEQRIFNFFSVFLLFAIFDTFNDDLIENIGDHFFLYTNNLMERFRPHTTSDLLLDAECIRKVKRWIRETTGKGHVLIVESVSIGVGISTLLRLACHEDHVEPVMIETSMPKLKTFLRDIAGSSHTVDFKKKILVIDSLDAVFSEPTCASELSDYFKTISPIPAICAGHRLRSSASKLHDMISPKEYHIETVTFPEVDEIRARTYLETIRQTLGKSAPITWNGDLRNALAAIDVDVSDAQKDEQCDGIDAVRRVLFDPHLTISDSITMHEGDVSMITAGTHENYPLTGQTIDACARMADIYSITDVMDECMYDTQRWELGDICMAISSGGPIVYLDKTTGNSRMDLSKFGTFWSRGNNQRTKEKAVRAIRAIMIERGMHASSHIESLATLRMIITSQRWSDILPIIRDIPNEHVLSIMRLWKCGFTQSNYSTLKKKRM